MCVQAVYPCAPYIAGVRACVRVCPQLTCSRGVVCVPQECVINKRQGWKGSDEEDNHPDVCALGHCDIFIKL